MRSILLAVFLAGAAFAQGQSYTATSGGITFSVMPWSTTVVPTAASNWRPVAVSGTWVTACASNPEIRSMKAVLFYRSGTDTVTVVQDFGALHDSGTGLMCGNFITLVKKESIISAVVVTASAEFTDIH